MFERLIRNKVEFSQLKRQRRMIPEIRRTLKSIYDELEDHPSVLDHLPIPGMGGVNSYFFTHKGRETTDIQMSKINQKEAEMVVGFYDYLVLNGLTPVEITVLTFYNGQRKLVLRKLREHRHLQGSKFNVVTVDSYQGEENEVLVPHSVSGGPTLTYCSAYYFHLSEATFAAILVFWRSRTVSALLCLELGVGFTFSATRPTSANPAYCGGISFELWRKTHVVLASICI